MDAATLYVQPVSAWVLFAALVSLLLNAVITRGLGSVYREPLTAPEYGLLVSDERAVLAALTHLRAANLLTHPDGEANLDRFTADVLGKFRSTGRPSFRRLTDDCRAELRNLRRSLRRRGLLRGPKLVVAQFLSAIPALAGVALCLTKLADTAALPEPASHLVIALIACSLIALFCLRSPRMTATGVKTLESARASYRRWHPSHQPMFATYDRQYAAVSAALFGGRTLWHVDPDLAKSWSVRASLDAVPSPRANP